MALYLNGVVRIRSFRKLASVHILKLPVRNILFWFVLGIVATPGVRGSILGGSHWTETSGISGAVGYDSNLFARRDGEGSSFVSLHPKATLSTQDAETEIQLQAFANPTFFSADDISSSVDPGMKLTISSPVPESSDTELNSEDVFFSSQDGEVHWVQGTHADSDLGRRVRSTDWLAKWSGDLIQTGKSGLVGHAQIRRLDYSDPSLDPLETASVGAGLEYSPNGSIRYGAGYDFTGSRSLPPLGSEITNQREHSLNVTARGSFFSKFTGQLSAGIASSTYSGAYHQSEWDLVAKGALFWQASERLGFDLSVARAPDFSADGDATLRTSFDLGAKQQIIGGFALRLGVQGSHVDFGRNTITRRDNAYSFNGGLDYDLTGKLTASIGFATGHQVSTDRSLTFTRNTVSATVGYRF